MKRIAMILAAGVVLAALPAVRAQQQPDPVALSRAIVVLQAQRNQAMDIAAAQQARADGLQDDLAKAKERIKELEAKAETHEGPKTPQ